MIWIQDFLGVGLIAPILIVSIGLFIYNSASSTITDSISTLSTQEIEAFNNQFTSYEGTITGSKVKALMGRLIANADIYKDESEKVPQVYIDQLNEENLESMDVTYTEFDEDDISDYINNLAKIRNGVEIKHNYFVEFVYQSSGLVDYIQISYDPENPILDYYRR